MENSRLTQDQASLRSVSLRLFVGVAIILAAFVMIRVGVSPQLTLILDNVHWTAAYTLAAMLAWEGVNFAPADAITARRWFAGGLTAYAFGQMLWNLQVAVGWNPFPGPSDLFFACLGPACLCGLWTSLRSHSSDEQRRIALLDATTLACAVLVLTLSLYLPKQADTPSLTLAVLAAYPVSLLGALCVGVIVLLTLRARLDRTCALFLIALFVQGIIWMRWNSLTLENGLEDGTWFNFCFSVTAIASGLGAMWWKPQRSTESHWDRHCEWLLRVLPLLSVVVAASSLLHLPQLNESSPGSVVVLVSGIAVVVVLAMARQSLLLAERDRLLVAEHKLLEQQDRSRILFESNLQGVFVSDRHGHIKQANDAFLSMTGFSSADLQAGRVNWAPLIPNHEHNSVQLLPELEKAGVSNPMEREFVRKDGSRIPVVVGAVRVNNNTGETIAFAIDATALKQAQAALHSLVLGTSTAGDDFFDNLVRELAAALQVRYAFIGQLDASMPGHVRTRAVWAGDSLMPNFSYPMAGTPCENVIGKTVCHYPDNVASRFPHDPMLVDMQAEAYLGIPLSASDGRPLGLLAVLHDEPLPLPQLAHDLLHIFANRAAAELQRHETEQSLRDSEIKFHAVFAQSPLAIVLTTLPDGRVADANAAAEILLGHKLEDARGRTTTELGLWVDPADRGRYLQIMLSDGAPYGFPARVKRPDGTVIALHCHGRVIRIAGQNYILNSMLDTTERQSLEEQLRHSQKMDAVGQLAGGVAHDFNNLLTVIIGHLGQINDVSVVSPQVAESLSEIAIAANRAASLTKQLLSFSRRQVFSASTTNLNAVVSSTVTMLRRILGEHIDVQVDIPEHQLLFHGNAGMLEQVLVNLAVNARDAMPNGGTLHISTSREAKRPLNTLDGSSHAVVDCVILTVADNGVGMPKAIHSRIFEPFFTTKDVGKGTGLGLATVFGIVQQHQGWIEFDSETGRGTRFAIMLPALPVGPMVANLPSTVVPARGRNELVLLVEDDAAVREMNQHALTSYGYRVITANSGRAALEVWREHKTEIALLLTDINMPEGVSGVELAQRLLKEDPLLCVVYSSGYGAESVGADLQLTEGVNYLGKPYELVHLYRTVRKALDNAKA